MIKKIIFTLIFSIFCSLSFNLFADQIVVNVGLSTVSGQPDYETDRFPLMIAFETKTLWRFSFTDTVFKHKDTSSSKIKAQVLGAESMWVYEISNEFSIIGAFGPGYYSVQTENQDGSGSTFGMMATGTFRFDFSESLFVEGAFHYRNVAVKIDDETVNGGYQGMMIGAGYTF